MRYPVVLFSWSTDLGLAVLLEHRLVTDTQTQNCECHRTCRTTASRSLVLTLGGICVPPTVNYLQYLATGSTLTAVRPFQLPAPRSGTLSRISSVTQCWRFLTFLPRDAL